MGSMTPPSEVGLNRSHFISPAPPKTSGTFGRCRHSFAAPTNGSRSVHSQNIYLLNVQTHHL